MKITRLINYRCFNKTLFQKFLKKNVSFYSTTDEGVGNKKMCNFGFQKVSEEIKTKLVHNLFSNVSCKYDIMNDLMSLFLHRMWKQQLVNELNIFLKYYSYTVKDFYIHNEKNFNEESIYTKEVMSSETITTNEASDESTTTKSTTSNKHKHSNNTQYNNINEEYNKNINKNILNSTNDKKNILKKFYKCKILDLAGGTGDVAFKILDNALYYLKKNLNGNISNNLYTTFAPNIIICDANKNMIDVGIEKAKKMNYQKNITWLIENAEHLNSIENDSIDIVTISFGIRNFTNISNALKEIHRVLKPGGRFLCLEFCKVNNDIINTFYKIYLNHFIPLLGGIIANDVDSYKYLAESIQTFLTPEELSLVMHQNGFQNISHTNMTMGVVSIHSAYKIT